MIFADAFLNFFLYVFSDFWEVIRTIWIESDHSLMSVDLSVSLSCSEDTRAASS